MVPMQRSAPRKRVAVTGASGLIGSALVRSLRADGHDVVRLVRRPARTADEVEWDPKRLYVDAAGLVGVDSVVHLAGAGVGERRWTEAYKQEIRDSRVLGTTAIAQALASLAEPPESLVCGTALGWYGDTGSRAVDESAPAGTGFLPEVCVEWEAAAAPAEEAGIRVAYARTGLVVAREGGAWGRLFPVFRAGLGGRMGDGRQYWAWLPRHPEVAARRPSGDPPARHGPVNLTAPEPVTNREVTAAMGRVLHRPTLFTVPAPALKLVLGDFAQDVLGSQRVLPGRLLETGFDFAFPTIDDSIRAAAH
ncbi:TIGR01777 family oxidoreductase [Streptomyces sp. NPDC059810]|uniref:TIGR01777 family oxidoreductase n=1 Tax=Streptomyces sp. NPDC059810 TaxID=3346956 RepID=UPI00364A35CE